MKKSFHFDKNNISLAALFFSSLAMGLSIYSIFYSRPELSKETIKIDGVEYPLIKREITSTSHPFYTGKMKLVDSNCNNKNITYT